MKNETKKTPMERLHLGDYVQVKGSNIRGVITNITKYNTDSIDNCKYSISYEDADLEHEADLEYEADKENCCCQEILNECAWFTREKLILIASGVYPSAVERKETI